MKKSSWFLLTSGGLLSLLLVVVVGGGIFRYVTSERRLMREGEQYLLQKNYPKALEVYTELVRLHPKSAAAYSGRGTVYFRCRQYDAAIAEYSQAIALSRREDSKTTCYVSRGVCYDSEGKWGAAADDFTGAIAIDPKRWNAYRLRGRDYSRLKRFNQALDDANEAIELKPNSAECYATRAIINAEAGQRVMAEADCAKLTEMNPNSYLVWNNAGWAMYLLNELPEAVRYDRRALELSPRAATTRFNLALCLVLQNNAIEANKEYAQAIAEGQTNSCIGALRELKRLREKHPNTPAIKEAILLFAAEEAKLKPDASPEKRETNKKESESENAE